MDELALINSLKEKVTDEIKSSFAGLIPDEAWAGLVETEKVMDNTTIQIEPYKIITAPKLSDWQCHLFGSNGDGISWRPIKGQEPNRFWRMMQYLCFGCKWVKNPLCQNK